MHSPPELIIHQTYWTLNQRIDSACPAYCMLGSRQWRRPSTNCRNKPSPNSGPCWPGSSARMDALLRPRLASMSGRYGHMPGLPVHFLISLRLGRGTVLLPVINWSCPYRTPLPDDAG